MRAIPAEVQFEFDRRMTRSIPVQVQWKGEGTNGYVVARSFVLPDTLEITGPAGHVQGIAAATTDPVNVSAVVGTSQFRVNAYVSDSYVRLRSSPQVVVTVSMRKK
ncbi:MAG: hypothetical protein C5B51_06560 [Terriglobia bacterium]|nr:MAG: hypothetical protein C5B51_06560 [Terriglobia bacterium]